jgi:hypothetical protein
MNGASEREELQVVPAVNRGVCDNGPGYVRSDRKHERDQGHASPPSYPGDGEREDGGKPRYRDLKLQPGEVLSITCL